MSGQLTLPKPRPRGHIVAAYGGGVNTIAMLVQMRREGMRPTAIVMADPGDEWPETIAYRDGVANPWLASIGWPTVTVVTRASEAQYRPRAHLTPQGTLREECERIASLPSIAYGFKKCSLKFKRDPANWWLARQPWALDVWARGEKITRAIGYDADEDYRVRDEFGEPWEAARLTPLYPLFTAGIDRDGCVAMIRGEGLPVPHKSACTFCPSNTLDEWRDLRDRHPDRYADAVAMSRSAQIDSPDVVGLMRCLPAGKRQLHLHVWNDDATACAREERAAIDCECAL
jgi:hypothetical protein